MSENIYIKIPVAVLRSHCSKCQGDIKLVSDHCFNKSCDWFKYRQQILDRVNQLSIFTFAGFKAEARKYLIEHYSDMLNSEWCSDIRQRLENHFREIRGGPISGRWYSNIFQELLPEIGWYIDGETRTHPKHRSRENRYSKRMVIARQA